MTQSEAAKELHDRVRQCFARHEFETFGDALTWMHNEEFETLEMEAGEQGYSKFSTDILWLISQFGPKAAVDRKAIDARKVPKLKPVKVLAPDEDDEEITTPPKVTSKKSPKRKTRRRRF